MKKAVLFVVAGAALYAAGHFTRYSTHPAAEEKKTGPVAAALAAQTTNTNTAAAAGTTTTPENVRKFTPGRPFPKGGAKLWLLSLAGMDFEDESRIPELLDIVQSVITMDEECTKEMADALLEIAQMFENDDPEIEKFENAEDLIEGGLMLAMLRLSQFNPGSVVEMLKKYPEAGDEMAMMFVFGRLTSQNPQRAEEMALTMPDENRADALQAVVRCLSNKDPRAALAMAQKHKDVVHSAASYRILENWAKREPQQAMSEAVKFAGETGEPVAVRTVLAKWMERDEAAATAWANAHDGPGKTTAQAMVLEAKAMQDASSALEDYKKLQASVKDQSELTRLTYIIADGMARTDLPSAKTWVESLPAGSAKDTAINELVEQWLEDDAGAASAWIKELPPGDARDGAAVQLSEKIVRRDPSSAFEWARNIQDEDLRGEHLKKVLEEWEAQDPDAARAAKETLPPGTLPNEDELRPPPPPNDGSIGGRIGGRVEPAR